MLSYAIMKQMQTTQLNIRVPKELMKDLSTVSGLLKVNRSEWVKTKLAEEVQKEKNRLLIELSTLYAKGMISKKEVEKHVGKAVAEEMEGVKKTAMKSIRKGIQYGEKVKRGIHR
jgi:post-segregation antitoxin (ccd killing protein)